MRKAKLDKAAYKPKTAYKPNERLVHVHVNRTESAEAKVTCCVKDPSVSLPTPISRVTGLEKTSGRI